jgi:phage FluMu protein Com
MTRPIPDSDAAPAPGASTSSEGCGHDDLRCACGSLLARRVGSGVELKCRRCKRTVVIPFEGDDTTA